MTSEPAFIKRISAPLAAWLVVLVFPFLYFFSELHATFLLEISSGAGAVWLGLQLLRRQLNLSIQMRSVVFMILVWLFLAARSVWVSVDPAVSWPVFIKAAALGLVSLVIAALLTSAGNNSVFYRAAAWAGIIHGVIAVHEYIEAPPIPLTWLDPAARSLFRTRCAGIFTDPNVFAAFLAALFILSLGLLLNASSRSERVLAGTAILLEGLAIFTTLSRGGWIGLAAGLFTAAVLIFRCQAPLNPGFWRPLLLVGLILTAVFFIGPFKMRFLSIGNPQDMTFAQRTLINKGIFAALKRFPIAGHGLHSFNQVYPRYRIVGGDYPMNAHNEFIHSMIETGFLSAAILALTAIFLFKTAWNSRPDHTHQAIFTAVFTSLLIQNLSGFSSRILPTSLLISVAVAGMLATHFRPEKRNSSKVLAATTGSIVLLIAVMLLVTAPISLWQQTIILEADELLRSGNLAAATDLLEKFVRENPRNANAYSLLANAKMASNEPKVTFECLIKATELNPNEALFFINLARLSRKRNAVEAEMFYQQALQLDPASEQFRLEFALFLKAAGRNSEALGQVLVGLTYSPGFHDVYKGFRELEKLKAELAAPGP